MPAAFVLIWSTGFVVARYGMLYAPPLSFLCLRYALSMLAFAVWLSLARPRWPQRREQWWHLAVTGVFMHAGYLGGVWLAVKGGLSAGMAALIVGLQPVLTALWLSSRQGAAHVSRTQWLGLLLGLAGLLMVVWRKMGAGEVNGWTLTLGVLALLSITTGTLYQKRFVAPTDVRAANFIQLLGAFIVSLPLALLETEPVRFEPQMLAALAWSVGVLTLGGSSLLFMLIQRGAATQVSSLMYLVPPTTALMAWFLFGENLSLLVVAGFVLTAAGVALVVRLPAPLPTATVESKET